MAKQVDLLEPEVESELLNVIRHISIAHVIIIRGPGWASWSAGFWEHEGEVLFQLDKADLEISGRDAPTSGLDEEQRLAKISPHSVRKNNAWSGKSVHARGEAFIHFHSNYGIWRLQDFKRSQGDERNDSKLQEKKIYQFWIWHHHRRRKRAWKHRGSRRWTL
jgi:hypothetical protein